MIFGLVFLALAMCGSPLLVATKLFGVTTGVITVSIAAVPLGLLWFVPPLRRRMKLNAERRRRA